MLAALGLKSTEKRWKPANKLQKDGKISKKAFIEYLELGIKELPTPQNVEIIARMRWEKKEGSEMEELMNNWQCQLIEHHGWEVNFGRRSISEWIETSGRAGQPGSDPKVVKPVAEFEQALRTLMTVGNQEGAVRLKLGLRGDGEDENGESEAILPRRFPKEEKLQVSGPVVRPKLIEIVQEARSMVLSLRTRELLTEVLKDYATWKTQALLELCSSVVIRWQSEIFEKHGVDRRLGQIEIATPRADAPELLQAQSELMQACTGLTMWYSMRPKPAAIPAADADDRRVKPWSRVDAAAEGDDGAAERQLIQEGEPDTALWIECMRGIKDEFSTESFGNELEECVATSGDLHCLDRWTREMYEAYGIHHDFGHLAANAVVKVPEIDALNKELMEFTKDKLAMRVKAGLRRSLEAKKKAAAEKQSE